MNMHSIMAKFQSDKGIDAQIPHIEFVRKFIIGIYNIWKRVVGLYGRIFFLLNMKQWQE